MSTIKKVIIASTACLAVLIGIAIAALPTIISHPVVAPGVVRFVNNHIQGTIAVQSLRLRWLGPQNIEGFYLRDTHDNVMISFESITADISLWDIMLKRRSNIAISVESPTANIVIEKSGDINVLNTLSTPSKSTTTGSHPKKSPKSTPFSLDAKIHDGTLVVSKAGLSPVTFSDVETNLVAITSHNYFTIKLNALTQQNDSTGNIEVDAAIEGPIFKIHNRNSTILLNENASIEMTAKMHNLPIEGIDSLIALYHPQYATLLTNIMGGNADIVASISTADQNTSLQLHAKAPNFEIDIAGEAQKDMFYLSPPSIINATITPELSTKLVKLYPSKLPTHFEKDIFIQVVLNNFHSPIELNTENVAIAGYITTSPIHFHSNTDNTFAIETLKASFDMSSLQEPLKCEFAASTQYNDQYSLLTMQADISNIFSETRTVQTDKINAYISVEATGFPIKALDIMTNQQGLLVDALGSQANLIAVSSGTLKQGDIDLMISSEKLHADYISLTYDDSLSLKEPATIHYTLSPPLIHRFIGGIKGLELRESSPSTIKLHKFSINTTSPLNLQKSSLDIEISSDPIFLKTPQSIGDIAISDLTFSLTGPSLSQAAFNINGTINQFDPLGKLHKFLGPTITTSFAGILSAKTFEHIDIYDISTRINSNNLHATLSGKISDMRHITTESPSDITYIITPKNYQSLDKPSSIHFTIDKADMPLPPISLAELNTKGSVNTERLSMKDRTPLNDIVLDFDITEGRNATFNLTANDNVINASGKISNITTSDGKLNKDNLSGTAHATINNLPTSLLGDISPRFHALLGNNVSAEIDIDLVEMDGPLSLELKSDNFIVIIDAAIKDNAIILREPLEASLNMTPSIGKHVLSTVNPFFASAIQGSQPITVFIDNTDFSMPINPFDTKNIRIKHANIDIGQLTLENQGALNMLIGFLDSRILASYQRMTAWFTPLDISIYNNIISCDRMDALIGDNYHIASWGTIDLSSGYTNMRLGIPADMLRTSFGISELPSSYIMQIPMEGNVGDINIAWEKAAAYVAVLATKTKAKKNTNFIFTSILKAFTGVYKYDKDPIPQLKNPLPWDKKTEGK